RYPGKVTSIFPRALYDSVLPGFDPKRASSAHNAQESYEIAARECREKVKRIVRECERTNQKFTDPDFSLELDPHGNCLNGLVRDTDNEDAESASSASQSANPASPSPAVAAAAKHRQGVRGTETYWPGSIHRIDWIFDSPRFTIDGFSSSDIKQGATGDCWWLAAVATIAHRKDLMERVCVARDEECGVYGFVFQRDGEWISTVVDDNLYLSSADFDIYSDGFDSSGKKARQFRRANQTGSEALYFAHCADPNETWLPLLEKAFAKVHGDYEALSGGWPGEAVEDMTGGVTSTIATNRVLRKDKLWKELTNRDNEFVFALAAMDKGSGLWQKTGLALDHAYSILQSREEVDDDGNKVRLVQVRNPWGERAGGAGEWTGPWSDGSKEWTPFWLKRLNHTFGDDGVFWMSYDDMLANFMFLHRTRLFDQTWTMVQQWTSANISWMTGFLKSKFVIEVEKSGLAVFVLTQLDDRYFRGLQGQYYFQLHFVLQKKAEDKPGAEPERICQVSPLHDYENRSVSCEVELEPGTYEVLPKITAERDTALTAEKTVEEVVKKYADKNPQKLRQVGMQYDIAHAKAGVVDEDAVIEKRKADAKAKEERRARRLKKQQEKLAAAAKAMEEAAKIAAEMAAEAEAAAAAEAAKTAEKTTDAATTTESSTKAKPAEAAEKKDEAAEKKDKVAEKKDEVAEKKDEAVVGTKTEEKPTESAKTETKVEVKPAEGEKKDSAVAQTKGTPLQTIPEAAVPVNGVEPLATNGTAAEEAKPEAPAAPAAPAPDADEDSDAESEPEVTPPTEELPSGSWNAVCVFGLRVYSQRPGLSIQLVQ
ncbi:hypothetical protein B0I35DRAFT_444114, partial [Stachybotrys elegans]